MTYSDPWNISKIFCWICFFFCSTHGFDIELYDILYSTLCKLYIANWCTWLAHTLCKGLIWNYKNKNCWAQPWLSFGILQALWWSWECIRYFFDWYRILYWNFEICTISLFNFGWWYTLIKNKHQISLYLGLKKMTNILQITFSNEFPLKKLLSVFLSVFLICLSVCSSVRPSVRPSVCLSVCLSVPVTHFSTMFPSWYHHEIFRSDYQWQKWCLCRSSRTEVKSQCYRGQNPN